MTDPTIAGTVVEIAGLTHQYRGGVYALNDVSVGWPAGIVALLGPNGAGKSTLLNIVTGSLPPSSGSVTVVGGRAGEHTAIGYLPQDAGWPGQFTIVEFLSYLAWARGLRRSTRRAAVDQAVEEVGLNPQRGERLGRLSGGQRRRAMLAQALLGDPRLLILDEPTTGFDPAQRVAFRELIAALAPGRTIVIATHLVEDVEEIADWVCVLNAGRVGYDGPISGLLTQDQRPRAAARSPLEGAFLGIVT